MNMDYKKELLENGIVIYKNFFSPDKISNIKKKSCEIFQRQFDRLGYQSDFDNEVRWSCHFRYTDLDNLDFINRGFPSPYTYKSEIKN